MKKLIAALLCNICLLSNSNSSSIVNPLHNIDNSGNQGANSMINIDCNSLNLTKTESFNSANKNYSSSDENNNVIKDNTERGRNWKKNKKKRENRKKRKQQMQNNDQSIQNETNIKNDNNTESKTISKSQNEAKREEILKEKKEKSDAEFAEVIKNRLKLKIRSKDFTKETIQMQDADDLITEDLNNISKKYSSQKKDYNTLSNIIQDVLNTDIIRSAILSKNDDINYFINSSKFKMLGNLHQQIMIGADNGNTVYDRFKIDDNILNNYKKCYEQLAGFISTFFKAKPIDIIADNYGSIIDDQIEDIINNIYIYIKSDDSNGLKNIYDIKCFLDNNEINSEKDLQGNNILKIMAKLAIVIYDCTQNIQYACLQQLAFGKKLPTGNTINLFGNNVFIELIGQLKTICNTFGIKTKK